MVSDSDVIDVARRALGARLAAYRRAAGHNQASLARLTDYSRSTVANVETGRQHVPREFWVHVDGLLGAAGTLIEASDQIEAAVRSEHQAVALRSGPVLSGTAGDGGELTGADGAGDGPFDVIAMAAAQARDHAERSAVTEIRPGTVEQLTAEVARVGRAYVSAPPLPLFAAMHQVLGRVQDSLERRAYPRQSRELNFLAGALCGLMANASLDLGREEAADDLGRAAWTYGHIIGFGPLMGCESHDATLII
ncbi:MAG TPA: helix-turn-helix transcriptional regulator [Streptosporangiaceae bacterium]|jgi:DNA-binding XRE family transcriptional regulator